MPVSLILSNFVVVVMFVGGIPSFLSDLPFGLKNMEIAIACAKFHAKRSWKYFCELITLITTIRAYRLLIKSSLFSFLLPAACMAEANPFRSCSTTVRFWVGFIVWWAILFTGAVAATLHASAGTTVLLIAGIVVLVLLVLSMISLSYRPAYWQPLQASVKTFSVSWSNLCVLFAGKNKKH